jgi:hypothetical protein
VCLTVRLVDVVHIRPTKLAIFIDLHAPIGLVQCLAGNKKNQSSKRCRLSIYLGTQCFMIEYP